ncbi:MAG: hypothetical protein WDM81_13080 [Rhizomicrobium sp.]
MLTKNWPEARRLLAPLAHDRASARVCALMAEIEEGENGDATAAHGWLARAARAARDAEWRCKHCGAAQSEWSAICPVCASFDTLAWSAVGGGEPAPVAIRNPPPEKIPPARGPVALPRPPDDPGPGGIEY